MNCRGYPFVFAGVPYPFTCGIVCGFSGSILSSRAAKLLHFAQGSRLALSHDKH
ncbi:hypothetical protein Plhal304r1_c008g0030621 [Plasmopara halstedii]